MLLRLRQPFLERMHLPSYLWFYTEFGYLDGWSPVLQCPVSLPFKGIRLVLGLKASTLVMPAGTHPQLRKVAVHVGHADVTCQVTGCG